MAKSKKLIRWPLGIGIIYAIFVILLLIFLVFSFSNTVDLVSGDYYAQDLIYQEQIDRKNRTEQLDKDLSWVYSPSSRAIELKFPGEFNSTLISGKVIFFRPSDARLDNMVTINPDVSGCQKIDVSELQQGMWRIKIFWKVNNADYYNEGIVYIKS